MTDSNITPNDIPSEKHVDTVEEAIQLSEAISDGDYVVLKNKNDLAKVLIYKRTSFHLENISLMAWDGQTINLDWFDPQNKRNVYLIKNCEQLAGLAYLVHTGHTFEKKIIRLMSDINLNHKEWTPIGGGYDVYEETVDEDSFYRVKNIKNTFSGTFDGNSHVIYGLTVKQVDPHTRFSGLFGSITRGTVKNLILEGVDVGNLEEQSMNGALFGYAKSSMFLNTVTSGKVCGKACGGFGSVAVDCSFYNCLNRTDIEVSSPRYGANLVVGGLVHQISLSNKLISKIHQKEPNVFIHCVQDGTIVVDAKGASSVWAGQLFGCVAHNPSEEEHSMIINRCDIGPHSDIRVKNFNHDLSKGIFFGIINDDETALNHTSGVGNKIDMLNGIVGKVSVAIGLTVIQITSSITIDSITLPGSVNTLKSASFSNAFSTVDTNTLREEDSIINLEPYFTYVKTSDI